MDLISFIDRGGVIVYVLIFLNIIGFTIMLWKFFSLVVFKNWHKTIINNIVKDLTSLKQTPQSIKNSINSAVKQCESGLNTIKIIALISPLFGLLGTVIGVLDSFDNITSSGLGDPTIFSSGISIALITTVAGLIVAIPHYVAYNYFLGVLDNLELKIEKEVLKKI